MIRESKVAVDRIYSQLMANDSVSNLVQRDEFEDRLSTSQLPGVFSNRENLEGLGQPALPQVVESIYSTRSSVANGQEFSGSWQENIGA